MTYREVEPVPTDVYRGPMTGFRGVGCVTALLVPPAVRVIIDEFERHGDAGGSTALKVILTTLAILLVVFAATNEESVVTIDAHCMRLTRRRTILGLHFREKIEWEIPLTQLTEARVITARSKDPRDTHSALSLPNGISLNSARLGGVQKPDTAYLALVSALEKRLGENFTREEIVLPLPPPHVARAVATPAVDSPAVRVSVSEPQRVDVRDDDEALESPANAADDRERSAR